MATYKDTEEILRKIYNLANKATLGETNLSYLDWEDAVYIIKEAPFVDVVEVVRCKDCVCFNNNMPTRPFCDYFGTAIDLMHFCSYGDRKEE